MNATNVASLEPKTKQARLQRANEEIGYCLSDVEARINTLSNETVVLRLVAELLQKRQKAVKKLLRSDGDASTVNVHLFIGSDGAVSHFTAEGRIVLKADRNAIYDQESFVSRLLMPFVHKGIIPSGVSVRCSGRHDTSKLRCAGYTVSIPVI